MLLTEIFLLGTAVETHYSSQTDRSSQKEFSSVSLA